MLGVPVLILCAAVITCYLYIKKRRRYWKELGVPTIDQNNAFVNTLAYLRGRRSLEELQEEAYNSQPDEPYIGTFSILMKPILFVRDPEIIYHMTIRDFSHFPVRQQSLNGGGPLANNVTLLAGDEWKTVRSKLIPTFSRIKLKGMYNLVEECTEMLVKEYFRPSARTGEPLDVKEMMARYSLDVVGKCVFGIQFNTLTESHTLYERVRKQLSDSGFMNSLRIFLQFAFPSSLKYLGLKVANDDVEKFFFNLLRDAEQSRREESTHRGDFLQLMLDIRNESSNKAHHLFTDEHIAANMFVFYSAGFETTAITLTFALYELALQHKVQEKLRHEIEKCREANNGVLDFETINNIAYLDMVVSETLRLHAPAPINSRMCTDVYQIPGTSLVLRPGDMVLYSMSAMHKDEKYFPDPLRFHPERFSAENIKEINPYAYMPFGSGPRMCLGERFAKMEIKICLATIISRFRVSACDKTEIPITLRKGGLFHAPQNEVWLSVEEVSSL